MGTRSITAAFAARVDDPRRSIAPAGPRPADGLTVRLPPAAATVRYGQVDTVQHAANTSDTRRHQARHEQRSTIGAPDSKFWENLS